MLFYREPANDIHFENYFSVGQSSQATQRAVVQFTGSDEGAGDWSCTKDGKLGRIACEHISKASEYMRLVFQTEDGAEILMNHCPYFPHSARIL